MEEDCRSSLWSISFRCLLTFVSMRGPRFDSVEFGIERNLYYLESLITELLQLRLDIRDWNLNEGF